MKVMSHCVDCVTLQFWFIYIRLVVLTDRACNIVLVRSNDHGEILRNLDDLGWSAFEHPEMGRVVRR